MSSSRFAIVAVCAVACGGNGQSVVELSAAKNTEVTLEAPEVDGAREYRWVFEASPASSIERLSEAGAVATLRADASGTFEIVRTARDGDTVLDAVRFIVTVTNDAPVAVVEVEFATTIIPGTLSAERSTDANGDSLAYEWEIVRAPAGAAAVLTEPSTARTALETDTPGLYEVALEIDDGDGGTARASRTLRVHGPAFAPIPGAGFSIYNPVAFYSPPHRELILGGPALRLVDVDAGSLSLDDSFASSVSPFEVSPDGEIVWLRQGARAFVVYRLATRTIERSRNILSAVNAPRVGSSDALYWSETTTDGTDVSAWFWQADVVVAGPHLDGAVSRPLVSQSLERVFLLVSHGNFPTGTHEYHQLALDNPPVEREGGASDLDWQLGGPVAAFADGRRLVTAGGGVVEISTTAPPRDLAAPGLTGRFQHNPAIERAAFLESAPAGNPPWILTIIDSEAYEVLSTEDVSAWAEDSPLLIFAHREGFLLVMTVGEDVLHALYVIPD